MWDSFKASGISPLPRSYHTATPVVYNIQKKNRKQSTLHTIYIYIFFFMNRT